MFKIFKVLVKAYVTYIMIVVTLCPFMTWSFFSKAKAAPVSDAIHGYHDHHIGFAMICVQVLMYLIGAVWTYYSCRATWSLVKSLIKDFA